MSKRQIIQNLIILKGLFERDSLSKDDCLYGISTVDKLIDDIGSARFTSGIDLTGQTFGQLTVVGIKGKIKWSNCSGYVYSWQCRCSCGRLIELSTSALLHHKGLFPLMCKSCHSGLVSSVHGKSKDPLYNIWKNMKQRCYYPDAPQYQNQGAKGIIVADEWVNDYPAFEEWALTHGYSTNSRFQRIDPSGNWEPGNCCFVPRKTITINGESHTLMQWAKIKNMDYQTLNIRVKSGVPQELWFFKGRITPMLKQKFQSEKQMKMEETNESKSKSNR